MPLKLNVGVSRKVGLPDYGSVGASCNLELELDSGQLERDLDGFQARVRDAYVAAHQAVHDELARLQVPDETRAERPPRSPPGSAQEWILPGRTGTARSDRAKDDRSRVRKPATPNQVKAILAIARRQNTDLGRLLAGVRGREPRGPDDPAGQRADRQAQGREQT